MVIMCLCFLLLTFHLVFVNITIMKRFKNLEEQIENKNAEVKYLLHVIHDNQERPKLAQLIKDKPKQFIRKPQ